MTSTLQIAAAACVTAFLLVPVGKALARQIGLRDGNGTPLLGGPPLVLAALVVVTLLAPRANGSLTWPLPLAALSLMVIGAIDDRRPLGALIKLTAQAGAAATVIWIGKLSPPLDDLGVAGWPLMVLWLIAMCNAFNLLDNTDGAAALVGCIAASLLALLALRQGLLQESALAAALAGVCLAFLPFNWPTASIYLGDAGSLPIGFLLGVLALRTAHGAVATESWLPQLLILAVPLFDTTLVCCSRLRRGRNPMTTRGRDHLAHRLLHAGLAPPAMLSLLASAGLLCGVLGHLIIGRSAHDQMAPAVVVLVLAAALILWLDRTSVRQSVARSTS